MKCDVVVIGAGPGGSMAAKTAAEAGLNVVLLEKRQEIGEPIRSEHRELIEVQPGWISTEVKGIRMYSARMAKSMSVFILYIIVVIVYKLID